jgi:mono/diheme cytochrome c family protein
VARRKRKNPWTSASEVILWLLFVVLLIPVGFAGYAVGHYTSIGKPPTKITVTVGTRPTTPATTSTSTPTTTSQTTTSSSGGDVAAGKVVFTGVGGCSGCHTFTPANASGTIGPNLDTAPKTDAKADGNMALAAFIKESITNPGAYISKAGNWSTQMPPDGGASLTPKQIDDLVAFILSGQQ